MHFEPSKELLKDWVCEGKIQGVTTVPHHTCPGTTASVDSTTTEEQAKAEAEDPEEAPAVADGASHSSMEDYLASNGGGEEASGLG